MKMKRCKRRSDGFGFNYLIYGNASEKEMALLDGLVFELGSYVVFAIEGPLGYTYESFMFNFEIVDDDPDIKVPYPMHEKQYIDESDLGVCRKRSAFGFNTCQWFYYSPGMSIFPRWFNREEFHELGLQVYNYFVHDLDRKTVTQYAHENFHENYTVVKGFTGTGFYSDILSDKRDGDSSVPCPEDLSDNVGECTSRPFPNDTIFEYIIYDKNSKWYPNWFPNKLKDHYLKHLNLKGGDFLVFPRYGNRLPSNPFSEKQFNELFEITKLYVPCLYDDVPLDVPVINECRKCSSIRYGGVYEYFMVGFDEYPEWFIGNTVDHVHYGDFVVYRNNYNTFSIYAPSEFSKLFVSYSKYCKNMEKYENDVQEFKDFLKQKLCKENNGPNVYVYYIVGKDSIDGLDECNYRYKLKNNDYVVRDFKTECGYSVYDVNMFVGLYGAVENRFYSPGDVVVKKEDIRAQEVDLFYVLEWFYKLPAKVMKYILLKHDLEGGKIDLVEIYKLENDVK